MVLNEFPEKFSFIGRKVTRQKRETIFLPISSILSREGVKLLIAFPLALPTDKLPTVPCLRRAASLAYTDADEDAERLLSFSDSTKPADGDEWVETHAGRKPTDNANSPGEIDDIPDVDDGPSESTTNAMANLSLGSSKAPQAETPDLDEIPDMEEELEGEEDEATAAPVKPPAANIAESRQAQI